MVGVVFTTHIDMLEMVIAKGDQRISHYYEQLLVPVELKPLGSTLRQRFSEMVEIVNDIKKQPALLQNNPILQTSMKVVYNWV